MIGITELIPNIPSRQKLSIGDVSKYSGVNISTLRYWEKEFHQYLRPERTPGGQRLYSKENVKILQEIKYLIDVEKYTIDGAKRRMHLNRQQTKKFSDILSDALKEVETGKPKKEVIANIVHREQLNI
jgi:DNA-binding transcriptional MerR regulator